MSYSSELKESLCRLPVPPEVRLPFCYGLTYFGRYFSRERICVSTENEAVAAPCRRMFADFAGADCKASRTGSGVYRLDVPKDGIDDFLRCFGISDDRDAQVFVNENVNGVDGARFFLLGAFLICGNMSDPENDFHLEFDVYGEERVGAIKNALLGLGFRSKTVRRGRLTVVYMASGDDIADFLGNIGAHNAMLEVIQKKAERRVRDIVNRRVNCDNANLKKSSEAAARQLKAVRTLEKHGALDSLPPELKELALLRAENPDMSLDALGRSLSVPVTRSCAARRLKKIESLAAGIKD